MLHEKLHEKVVLPFLADRDSETWHKHAVEFLHVMENGPIRRQILKLFAGGRRVVDPRLQMQLGNLTLENPLLVAAGWDKEGRAVRGLYELGFAGVEVGSVLHKSQIGNPKPRQRMLTPPDVCLNARGFDSGGMEVADGNLARYLRSGIPIGINIGKNKEGVEEKDIPEAYAAVARKLAKYASYIVINVSSPNTPGLRILQDEKPLTDIVQAVKAALLELKLDLLPGIYVKLAPDLEMEAVDGAIRVATTHGLAGLIASNTTIDKDIKAKYGVEHEPGGISGNDPDFRKKCLQQIRHIYRKTEGELAIIGVGGIDSAERVIETLKAGASAIGIMTAMRPKGLHIAHTINQGLVDWLHCCLGKLR